MKTKKAGTLHHEDLQMPWTQDFRRNASSRVTLSRHKTWDQREIRRNTTPKAAE
jgi:hypothetical protein